METPKFRSMKLFPGCAHDLHWDKFVAKFKLMKLDDYMYVLVYIAYSLNITSQKCTLKSVGLQMFCDFAEQSTFLLQLFQTPSLILDIMYMAYGGKPITRNRHGKFRQNFSFYEEITGRIEIYQMLVLGDWELFACPRSHCTKSPCSLSCYRTAI